MTWQISGQYMETCNCKLLCPCITSNLAATPTEGDCKAALGMRIDKGNKDGVSLDGVQFMVVLQSKGAMGAGDMTVGLIVDSDASDEQVEAITAIASGAAGGPMGMMAPLVGKFAGVERAKVDVTQDGSTWKAHAGDFVDQSCEALLNMEGEPMALDKVSHPVNSRLGLAKATQSMFDVFGIKWNDSTGQRNGHFAPFSWAG
ncbi:DUF1326 domain-containing protein [Ramlibacter sp. AW1]|uniref:DUF1326 domain-containing protein n=1 Tax=Ramlibacter aurantiacus TaxID=2801330 RepID=A0A936ZI45_9BURK|nr:DUF1326 domain-containing protein [Ramlibacter aurantiacus]MBL0421854.1 DUF1326 domain-containing protein [Ramlibacter aurantiacus]